MACCSPQNVVNVDHPFRSRKVEAVSDYPTSRLNASDEKLGLDWISSTKLASIPIADRSTRVAHLLAGRITGICVVGATLKRGRI